MAAFGKPHSSVGKLSFANGHGNCRPDSGSRTASRPVRIITPYNDDDLYPPLPRVSHLTRFFYANIKALNEHFFGGVIAFRAGGLLGGPHASYGNLRVARMNM